MMYTPVNSGFTIYKSGFKGLKIISIVCFVMHLKQIQLVCSYVKDALYVDSLTNITNNYSYQPKSFTYL